MSEEMPVQGDEVRVTPRMQGDVTLWQVDVYLKQTRIHRIGHATNKFQALTTALDLAERVGIAEVNVMGSY